VLMPSSMLVRPESGCDTSFVREGRHSCPSQDLPAGGATGLANWQMLLPVDGSVLVGVLNNAANATFDVSNRWLWWYIDGLLVNRAGASDGPSATFSIEAGAQPNPARGGGGTGTQNTGSLNLNLGADPYLTLDPSVGVPGGALGVNQLAGYVSNGNGDVLGLYAEVQYAPLYLWPR